MWWVACLADVSECVEKLKEKSLTHDQVRPLLEELGQHESLEALKALGYFYYVRRAFPPCCLAFLVW